MLLSYNNNCYIDASGGIVINNDVSIAHSSTILSTSHKWQDKSIPIKPDWVVTVVEPLDSVKKMYEDRLNELEKQTSEGTSLKG